MGPKVSLLQNIHYIVFLLTEVNIRAFTDVTNNWSDATGHLEASLDFSLNLVTTD